RIQERKHEQKYRSSWNHRPNPQPSRTYHQSPRSQHHSHANHSSGPEPMDLDTIKFKRLTQEEKDKRRKEGLCMYCGAKGHFANKCPKKSSPSTSTNAIQESTPEHPVKTYFNEKLYVDEDGNVVED